MMKRIMLVFLLILAIFAFFDAYKLIILVRRLNHIEKCVGMRKDDFLEIKLADFGKKWGCSLDAREYDSDFGPHRIIITIGRPISFFAYLFTDYTNLLYVGVDNGYVSCVFCAQ